MSVVKANNITGEKPSHECGQWGRSGTKKKVGMIRQKSPRITACLCGGTEDLKPFNKILTIFIVSEYLPAFYPANHYMV